jgi:hypothetical protein
MNIPFCLFLFVFLSTAVPSIDSRFINSWDLCCGVNRARFKWKEAKTMEKGFCRVILMYEQFLSPRSKLYKVQIKEQGIEERKERDRQRAGWKKLWLFLVV